MHRHNSSAALFAMMMVGCAPTPPTCGSAWASSNQSIIDLKDKSRVDLGAPISMMAEVSRCYLAPRSGRSLTFRGDDFIDQAGNRYFVYETGTLDAQFVVVVDRSGKITQTGAATLNF